MEQIEQVRLRVNRLVYRREGGRCLVCNRPGSDFHEIEQRSHHPRSRQVESGTFSEGNVVLLCRRCHSDIGNTRLGEMMLRYLLYARYGYKRPDWLP